MSTGDQPEKKPKGLALIGPGLLVAATGVGAGDLATGALAGARLGTAVLWAVIIGAGIKFILNEGLARWQLATDSTVIEGTRKHFGRGAVIAFFAYLCFWSFFVGAALMSACGIAAHAIYPLYSVEELSDEAVSDGTTEVAADEESEIEAEREKQAARSKQTYGVLHSALAVVLVTIGGYRLFEKAMRICIGVMFVTVIVAAIAVKPDWADVFSGLVFPQIPDLTGKGLKWTIGLMGGVGGTVTVLCYGYWIREEGRRGLGEVQACRVDLITGYSVTAIFGVCMVILGSKLPVNEGIKGATLIAALGDNLRDAIGGDLGTTAKIAFLLGAWGAIASSMLGVWQSVPYLFADSWRLIRDESKPKENSDSDSETSSQNPARHPIYRGSLVAIATVPAIGLFTNFETIQLAYAVVGAAFMPLLALALVILNGRAKMIGEAAKNSKLTNGVLIAIVLFFAWASFYDIRDRINKANSVPAKPRTTHLADSAGAAFHRR